MLRFAGRCHQRRRPVLRREDIVDLRCVATRYLATGSLPGRGSRLPSWCSSRRGTAWYRHPATRKSRRRCRWCRSRWCCWMIPRSSSFFKKLTDLSVMLDHAVWINPETGLALRLALSRVQMCMRLGLNHKKNGFCSLRARSMKFIEAVRNSSSIVSMRFLVSGPVSSHFCLPHGPNREFVARRDGRRRGAP